MSDHDTRRTTVALARVDEVWPELWGADERKGRTRRTSVAFEACGLWWHHGSNILEEEARRQ